MYTADTGNRDDILNLKVSWDRYQCIIFTGTITHCEDYTTPVWRVYVFPAIQSSTPRETKQGVGRFRKVNTNETWVAHTPEVMPVPLTLEDSANFVKMYRAELDAAQPIELERIRTGGALTRAMASDIAERLKFTLPPRVISNPHVETPHELLVIHSYVNVEREGTETLDKWANGFKYASCFQGDTVRIYDPADLNEDDAVRMHDLKKEEKAALKEEFHAAKCRMHLIDASGVARNEPDYVTLQKLGAGEHVKDETFAKFKETYEGKFPMETPRDYMEAALKAKVIRVFPHSERPNDPLFIAKFKKDEHILQLLQLHNCPDKVAVEIDFFQRMNTSGTLELTSAQPLQVLWLCNKLAAGMGLASVSDYGTVVSADAFDAGIMTKTLQELHAIGVGRRCKGDDFQKACSVMLTRAGLQVKDDKQASPAKALKELLDEGPILQSVTWYKDKWRVEVPVIDNLKGRTDDTRERLLELRAIYAEDKSEMYRPTREMIDRRIAVPRKVHGCRKRTHMVEANTRAVKITRTQQLVF